MHLNQRHYFLSAFTLLFGIFLIWGCASIQRPQGGPRDRTPPKVVSMLPVNMTRNFKAKEIRIEFDEYFRLNNAYQEISISPVLERQPEYTVKSKTLVIALNDTLQENTTYVFNFGKAIADVNESNQLKNFTYVFSTGNTIDSLSISGTVTNTLTSQTEKDATVMIFPARQDSILFGKKKPSIFTTTDSAGNFSLNNLHEGEYAIYALKELSPDKIYNNENELITFSKNRINLKSDVSGVKLDLFKQVPENFRVSTKRIDPDGKLFLQFNKSLVEPSVRINYPPEIDAQKIVDISKTKDTALVYLRNMSFDSLSVVVSDQGKPMDTVYVKKGRNESFKRNISLQYNINVDNKLRPNTDLEIFANLPIESQDNSRIKLLEDSVAVTGITLQKDAANPKRMTLKHRWRQNTRYELIFSEEALTSIYGDKSKELTKRFQIDKPENYGSLTVKYSVPDTAGSYIVELTNAKNVVLKTDVITKTVSIVYRNLFTGKYRIKVTYDNNRNGRFDSGSIKQKRYPEKIWYSDKELTLRPNWDQEETVEIPKEAATP